MEELRTKENMSSRGEGHCVLEKWNSCACELAVPSEVPEHAIKKLHIYDFDNTLFATPGPTEQLYTRELLNLLTSSVLPNGGWWNEPEFLRTAIKTSSDQPRRFSWNEEIVKLAERSYRAKDTVSIVLTGREEGKFHELIQYALQTARDHWECSPNEFRFNAVCLKKTSMSKYTSEYKKALMQDFLEYYPSLRELTIYDDRAHQIEAFKSFFRSLDLPSLQWFAIPVRPFTKSLPREQELKLIREMVSENNIQASSSSKKFDLAWTPKQIGYMLNMKSHRLLSMEVIKILRRMRGRRTFKPKLYEYPMYIPCAEPGKNIPALEVVKIWSNDGACAESEEKVQRTLQEFQQQQSGRCMVRFQVTDLAIVPSTHHNKKKPLEVYFRATPEPNRYTFSLFPEFIVTGHFYTRDEIEDIEAVTNRLTNSKKAIRWTPLDNAIPIKTSFEQFDKLASVPYIHD
ncbi:uncharacterized protein SKDI_13G3940 [Saccharomyces kudriavzevii IFO 1802]|uniref:Uncharacterized protein n=2 Tax=Saccharomyces kudriavzevii (strain ATCC MYA-4449 / AS 2.2408 / CBS 8840 / NBRC 1802 / NCYC 2889) TaxID=226230 RepID=A0AA35NLT2_SACK1|nr:uncharacterized protein SKDI_13G3940 [Saccharomyces kudriavzevii IFO 1802]EJT42929.1 YMR265C-like protein [Saccharomyces kudriavzevii IFO 1802]CAI4048843.1 hypothetical protein SKDI_13G3940 [Saccharomyces kudriavzevii IFO 1802]